MNAITKLTTAAVAVSLAAAGVAVAADAPVVSKQDTIKGTAPLTIPGTGVKKGDKLPAGARIVHRDVTLEGRQTVRITLTAPKGDTIRGVGIPEGSDVGGVALTKDYVGRRRVVIRAFLSPHADGEATGGIYALTR